MFFLPLFDDNPIKKIPWVTYTIIGLNILVFLFQSSLSSSDLEIFFKENGFISREFFSNSSLLYSNLYTSLFIHGGFFHLFSNMLYLWIFGDNIEAELGSIKFLIFYLVCGVIASLAQGIVDPDSLIPLIGASGAVAGILGAYLILYPSANVRVFVWIFIFIQIINVPAGIVLAIWIIGFSIEVISDEQKKRFKRNVENKNKFISTGLWKFSRHPNYFGEMLIWIGISIISFPTLTGFQYLTLISPFFVIWLLINISGINLLEEKADLKWGSVNSYIKYKKHTPVLSPFSKTFRS